MKFGQGHRKVTESSFLGYTYLEDPTTSHVTKKLQIVISGLPDKAQHQRIFSCRVQKVKNNIIMLLTKNLQYPFNFLYIIQISHSMNLPFLFRIIFVMYTVEIVFYITYISINRGNLRRTTSPLPLFDLILIFFLVLFRF